MQLPFKNLIISPNLQPDQHKIKSEAVWQACACPRSAQCRYATTALNQHNHAFLIQPKVSYSHDTATKQAHTPTLTPNRLLNLPHQQPQHTPSESTPQQNQPQQKRTRTQNEHQKPNKNQSNYKQQTHKNKSYTNDYATYTPDEQSQP